MRDENLPPLHAHSATINTASDALYETKYTFYQSCHTANMHNVRYAVPQNAKIQAVFTVPQRLIKKPH